jgi:hypothetical protein
MATYQGIKGRTVQNLASDPPAAVGEGQVWYNTASDVLKVSVGVGAWASGGNMGTARYQIGGAGTTNTAAIGFTGHSPSPPVGTSALTEEYDGTSWSAGGAYPKISNGLGYEHIGSLTAALGASAASTPSTVTAEYNGSSWTAGGSCTIGANLRGGIGTQTAALLIGGRTDPGPPYGRVDVEEYDGDSWTAANNLTASKRRAGAIGTTSAAVTFGGDPGTQTSFNYDGTSWTAGNGTLTARGYGGGSAGIQTNGITYGGGSPRITTTETYDGTSWSAGTAMGTARYAGCCWGLATDCGMGGGSPTPGSVTNITEEYSLVGTIQTITST